MNMWTEASISLANQRNYLDLLFRVYPTIPEDCREIEQDIWNRIEQAFNARNTQDLISNLLRLELFPIKDSYVAYLKRDPGAIARNPETVNRLAGRIFDLGLNRLYENCSAPKETNRQIGPLFKRWVNSGALGIMPVPYDDFINAGGNAILDGSDAELMRFSREHLGYNRNKGLDFLGKFNGRYVIGEAKFLTDFGGHQNAQFADAMSTLDADCNAVKVAILDGVLYIPGHHKMFKEATDRNACIMSALVFRDFLYQV